MESWIEDIYCIRDKLPELQKNLFLVLSPMEKVWLLLSQDSTYYPLIYKKNKGDFNNIGCKKFKLSILS
ncbi:MAG: hypothetical protein ACM3X7_09100 [Solirubrobacterales bacterium]